MSSALEDARTRRLLHRHRSQAWFLVGLGPLLLIAFVVAAAAQELAGSENEPVVWLTFGLLVAGTVSLIGGAVALFRDRRWRRILAEAEWREARFRRERARQLDRYRLDDGRIFDAGASWRFFLPAPPTGILWLAQAPDGRAVAATPGPGRFIGPMSEREPSTEEPRTEDGLNHPTGT
jgi:hypothetical protein